MRKMGPISSVLLCLDGEDIAFVASTNHLGKVWIVHIPISKWRQCDCPLVVQVIICKHVMNVFKMLHPNIDDLGQLLERSIPCMGSHGVLQF